MRNLLPTITLTFLMGFGLLLASMTETVLSLEIDCPTGIVVDLPAEACDAVVNFQVSASDNTDPNPQITQIDLSGFSSGDAFPIGTHVLEFDAVNSSGLTVNCSFQVQVNEHTPSAGLDCIDDNVVYVGPDSCLTLTPQMVLDGNDYGCYDNYTVDILIAGFSNDPILCCDDAGEMRVARIIHPEHGTCWGLLIIIDVPLAEFSMVQLSETTAQFENNSIGGASYFWDFGDGNTSTAENPVHDYGAIGTYLVTLQVTNACGTSSFTQEVELLLTSINELNFAGSFNLFPNPNNGVFQLELIGDPMAGVPVQFSLYDVLGRRLWYQEADFSSGEIREKVQMEHLDTGVYVLEVRVGVHALQRRVVLL